MRQLLFTILIVLPTFANSATTEAVYGENAMISSRSTLASEAGIEIMRQGGNAVDGAVATAFALAVTYPSAGNLGGGGFAVIMTADGEVITQDHREVAPLAAHRDMYLDEEGNEIKGMSRTTLLATGVPGSVDGLLSMLEKYGTMSRKQVMAPAIRLASQGFILNFYLARHISTVGAKMGENAAARAIFMKDGQPLKVGDRLRQKDLANTLKRIAKNGREGFYAGKTAKLIVAEMERGGGIISLEDLAQYRSTWREPVHTTYRDHDVWTMGPPSSAVLILQMLNMIEPLDVRAMGWGSAQAIHTMIEAERRAYADRAEHLGDPEFFPVPLAELASKSYAKSRFENFDPNKASDSDEIFAGEFTDSESPQTTHFSVMSKDGMAVSFTTTLNSPYGNKIVVPGTGILLNNEMDDFSIKPDTANQYDLIGRKANEVAPGKRMLSSMSPTIVSKAGKAILATGSPGGSTIITTTFQVILNVIDHQMSLDDAVSRPRFHHAWKPNRVIYERFSIPPDAHAMLKAKGHLSLIEINSPVFRGLGDANSVLRNDGIFHGVKDPRAEGTAVGY